MKEAAQLAITHRLYVPQWDMRKRYMTFIERGHGLLHIALYYDGNTPIAAALITSSEDIQVFVRTNRRREGIGTKLVEHMKKEMGDRADRLDAGIGVEGSGQFWKVMNIKRWDWSLFPYI